jgi:MFS family permease
MSPQLFYLILSQLCLHACMAGVRLAVPLLALKMGYSPLAVGVLLALFSLMQVVLGLPAGRFVDRHGFRLPVRLAALAAMSGTLMAVFFPSFGVLALAALMTGGATGVAVIAVQRQAGRMAQEPEALRRLFSWLAIGPAVSNFVGPLGAGLLIDFAGRSPGDALGYQVAFGALAAFPLISLWAVGRVVDDRASAVAPAPKGQRAWDLLRDASFRRLLIVNWCLSSCWDVHTFVVPLLGHERGLSASVIGTLLGAFAVAATAVRLVLPVVAGRLSEWKVITTAMLVTASMFAVYPFLHNPWSMGFCSVVLGVALGSVQPMVMSMLHQITPERRHGEAIGLRLMTINASSVLMPLLFGSAGALVGVGAVFWATGAAVAAGSRTAWHLQHARRHVPAAVASGSASALERTPD